MADEKMSAGSVSLDLEINDKTAEGIEKARQKVNAPAEKLGKTISDTVEQSTKGIGERLSSKIQSALDKKIDTSKIDDGIDEAIKRWEESLKKSTEDIENIEMPDRKVKLSGYEDYSKVLKEQLKKNMENLENKLDGFDVSSEPVERLKQEIELAYQKLDLLQKKWQELSSAQPSDKVTSQLNNTEKQIISTKKAIEKLEAKYKSLNQVGNDFQKITQAARNAAKAIGKTALSAATLFGKVELKSIKLVASGLGKIGKSAVSALSPVKKLGTTLKNSFRRVFVLASLYAAFRAIKDGVGQALKANDEFMNSLNQVKANLAIAFTPIMQAIMPALNALMSGLATVTKSIAGFIAGLFGTTYKQAASATQKLQGVTKAAKKAKMSTAGIDEMNILSSNKEDDSADNGGIDYSKIDMSEPKLPDWAERLKTAIKSGDWAGVGAILAERLNSVLGSINWDSIEQKVKNGTQKVVDGLNGFIRNVNWDTIGDTLAGGLNTLTGMIDTFFSGTDWGALGAGVAVGLNRAVEKTDWEQLGRAFVSPIQAAIDFAYEFVTNFKWKKFGNSIGKALNAAFDKIDFKKLGKTLSEGIKGILDAAVGILDTTDFKNIGSKIADLINNIDIVGIVERMASLLSTAIIDLQNLISGLLENTDWGSLVSKVIDSIFAALKAVNWGKLFSATFETMGAAIGALGSIAVALVKKIWELLVDAYNSVKDYFSQKIEECGGNVVAGIFSGIIDAFSSIGKWIKDHIFKPFIDGFKKAFDIHSPSKEMYTMGGYIVDGLFNAVSDGIAKIKEIFTKMLDAIKAVFEKVDTWFEEKFSSAWEKISAIFIGAGTWFSDRWTDITNAFSNVIGWFKDIFQKAWDGITAIFSWSNVNETFTKVWTTIKDCFWNVVDWFGDKFQKAYDKITGVFSGIGSFFVGIWKDITNGIVDGLNWGIGKINDAINKLNGFSFKLPSFLGGGKVGFDIPNIPDVPHLAAGGLAAAPTLAMVGDNKNARSDPEVIAPLSKLKDMLGTTNDSKIIELLLIIIELIKGGKDIHLINQIGTSEISREIIRIISEENSRTGG